MSIFSRYNNALNSERFHIRSLRIVIFGLIILCGYLGYALQSVPKTLTIHNPPDLRSGSVRAWWEIPPLRSMPLHFTYSSS